MAKDKQFWWFQGDSVNQLTTDLLEAGDGARLEVHLNGDAMTLFVKSGSAVVAEGGGGGINDSHICPPVCP